MPGVPNEALAALVRDAVEKAVAEEREACARVCEESVEEVTAYVYPGDAAETCAKKIRARGAK